MGFQEKRPSHRPVPQQRHNELFPNAKAPRTPNFNPDDEHQRTKGGWVKDLKRMNESAVGFADFVYRSRAQSLVGVDEIIEDVVAKLEEKGVLDNTYGKTTYLLIYVFYLSHVRLHNPVQGVLRVFYISHGATTLADRDPFPL